jgi:mRNA interferase HigB
MRIIKISTLRRFWMRHSDAEKELRAWIRITAAARWVSPAAVKQQFGARVDFIRVGSGNTVAVFDIANNKYRMIAAVHYDYPRLFVLRIFDHREYDKNKWKEEL